LEGRTLRVVTETKTALQNEAVDLLDLVVLAPQPRVIVEFIPHAEFRLQHPLLRPGCSGKQQAGYYAERHGRGKCREAAMFVTGVVVHGESSVTGTEPVPRQIT